MRKISSVLLISVLLVGCVNGKFHKKSITGGPCGTVDGYTYTLIAYGNGSITVIPVSRIRANTEWRFYLYPIEKLGGPAVYGNSKVHIKAKTTTDKVINSAGTALELYSYPTPTPATDGNNWINVSKEFNNATGTGKKRYITECVPTDVQLNQEWHYSVEIDDVGIIDPRARVEL